MIHEHKAPFMFFAFLALLFSVYFLIRILNNANMGGGDLSTGPRYKLDVLVTAYPILNQQPNQPPTPITDTAVEAVPVGGGSKQEQHLDNFGHASFNLPAGNYTVEIVSGYTGKEEVSLHQDMTVTIKAISITN